MKNQTLKDFFCGNLTPVDRQVIRNSEVSRAADTMLKAETQLRAVIPNEALPFLDQMENAQLTVNAATEEAFYLDGFKTGARLMMEILDDAREHLEPISG